MQLLREASFGNGQGQSWDPITGKSEKDPSGVLSSDYNMAIAILNIEDVIAFTGPEK